MFAASKTAGAVSAEVNYIEDVFSTYLYTGTGASQTITNGIDLSTKGGMIWTKDRNTARNNVVYDTTRGLSKRLVTNTTAAQTTATVFSTLTTTSYNADWPGTSANETNANGETYVSWTFRKQPKFFDVVTYTGNGASNRSISHNLGSAPGFMIIKSTTQADDWYCYHRSLSAAGRVLLNSTNPYGAASNMWNNTDPTSTVFTIGSDSGVNGNGQSYVAYLFAHDAGGFGLTGTDNVISCGSYTEGSSDVTVSLGYEPAWILVKPSSTTGNWNIYDTMRGAALTGNTAVLRPNTSDAEAYPANYWYPTSTGFVAKSGNYGSGQTIIYIAIRRGPMKVPTSGTSVFVPTKVTGSAIGQTYSIGFPSDLFIGKDTSGASYVDWVWQSRLTGDAAMSSDSTSAESITAWGNDGVKWTYQNSIYIQSTGYLDTSPILYTLRRAPSFFDEVCYTGTGSATTFNHNLGVTPELMIVKKRNAAAAWATYSATLGNTQVLFLDKTDSAAVTSTPWNDTSPTASVFTVGTSTTTNASAATYVAYLFATCAGVSKVGSYTGNGSTQTINCGFTGGARFVLIKRTDSTGNWYVYDTARGMTTLTDPYLLLNSTAAESATLGSVTTVSTGFAVDASILAAVNTNAASYIFLAVA